MSHRQAKMARVPAILKNYAALNRGPQKGEERGVK